MGLVIGAPDQSPDRVTAWSLYRPQPANLYRITARGKRPAAGTGQEGGCKVFKVAEV